MKKILITGKNSYVGMSLEKWLGNNPDSYSMDSISLRDDSWKEKDFSEYDVVFHVAAVVHKKERPEMETLYFEVNRDLSVEVAKRAKVAGVKQFIFMSTMAVYGEEGKLGQEVVINRKTPVNPKTFYGFSKVEAEAELNKLNVDNFRVVVLRPPMVYGPNCPGNYAMLEKIAEKSPVFPMIENKRSMLHIDKLCQSIKEYIDNEVEGLYFPQDDEYVNTCLMVKELAGKNGKSIHLSRVAGMVIEVIGKRVNLINKVFGNLVYEKE
ncbi:NAD-dependent epimerase/dehydratase family protein [Ornithinibacillus sp. L9]|uniref:NAD-dependent epimerase/dehydratase family protein n=1 Tax=Ornithinibacillus caprae TaxID=2678566 RepID=A0A6N8FGL9_9BACI|nr:NAD-dependent epimerase/dehydratase family protein [Ornithinibacillus caprae]MUK87414.1 NAD-dependent epimerase/dehydratase family protein [Ornithinibacillus caprae]